MKKIEMEDILKYRIPGNLKYSPDGKILAFQVTEADRKKNEYRTAVWLAENGSARQVTHTLSASVIGWEDSENLILRRTSPDSAEPGLTELFLLDVRGGEARPWMRLPFPLQRMERLGEGRYIASGRIRMADPDAFLDPEDVQ